MVATSQKQMEELMTKQISKYRARELENRRELEEALKKKVSSFITFATNMYCIAVSFFYLKLLDFAINHHAAVPSLYVVRFICNMQANY